MGINTAGTTTIRFDVERPVTDWEKSDIEQAIRNIMNNTSFFYAGNDDLGTEILKFLADNPIITNLEQVPDDEASIDNLPS